MDENPYKSPGTSGATSTGGGLGNVFRILAAILLAVCGILFTLFSMLSVYAMDVVFDSWILAVVSGVIAAACLFSASQITRHLWNSNADRGPRPPTPTETNEQVASRSTPAWAWFIALPMIGFGMLLGISAIGAFIEPGNMFPVSDARLIASLMLAVSLLLMGSGVAILWQSGRPQNDR